MTGTERLVRRAAALLAVSTLAAGLASAPAVAQATRVFGGRVLEVNAKEKTFVMQGGGSKKYPRPKIRLDAKTRWTGVPRKSKAVQVGDPVRVNVVTEKDGTFRAVTLELQNPDEKPTTSGASGVGR